MPMISEEEKKAAEIEEKETYEIAIDVLKKEANAIKNLVDIINDNFVDAVYLILASSGRIIVTGIGKSGLVGRKIAATLASVGTPAMFLHPAEGSHGDLGIITHQDIVLAVSNSGQAQEIVNLLPAIKRIGAMLITITSNSKSVLAKNSEIVLNIGVKKEAGPLGLVPTSSTTATMALGDALAICLLKRKGFTKKDYALFHPGGTLGKKLLLRVSDLMRTKEIPKVKYDDPIAHVIIEMSEGMLGMTIVVNSKGNLLGVISDGDLRRAMRIVNKYNDLFEVKASSLMSEKPKKIKEDKLAIEALRIMQTNKITFLICVNRKGSMVGVLHIHDLLNAGIA